MTFNEAIELIENGKRFNDKATLEISIYGGWTVAHAQLRYGWRTEDPEILSIKGETFKNIAECQLSRGWEPKTPEAKAYILAERLKK